MLLSKAGGVDSAVQLITVLIIFVAVLFITLYVTKWVAGFQKHQMIGKNMKVIETMRLTPTQFVQIVKVGKQYLAIAVSKEQVTLLAKLEEDELTDTEDEAYETDFSKVFDRFKRSFVKGSEDSTHDVQDKDEEK